MAHFATRSLRLHKVILAIGLTAAASGLVFAATQAQIPQALLRIAGAYTPQMNADNLHNQGMEKIQRGNYRGAIADYNQALQLNPQDADAYYNRGIARSELRDYRGAIADYNQALQLNPQDADAYYNRGIAHYALGNPQAAVENWNQALQINPHLAEAYGDRGFVRAELGDRQEAVSDWQKAAKLFFEQGNMEGYQQTLDLLKKFQQQ